MNKTRLNNACASKSQNREDVSKSLQNLVPLAIPPRNLTIGKDKLDNVNDKNNPLQEVNILNDMVRNPLHSRLHYVCFTQCFLHSLPFSLASQ